MSLRTRILSAKFPYGLRVSQLVEPVLVDAEIVRQLVQDRDPDLPLELLRVVAELLDERPAEDRDLVRKVRVGLPQPEQVWILRVLLLDHDREVLEALRELGRQRVERPPYVLLEPHQLGLSGRRTANTRTANAPNTKPPTCAANATPPPASGCVIALPPAHSWNRNQKPRKKSA